MDSITVDLRSTTPTEERPVLLVAAAWKERALLLAELQERGFDVRAMPGIVPAIGFLVRRPRVVPRLVILDVGDDPDIGERTLRDLLELTEGSPWLVIASTTRTVDGWPLLTAKRATVLTRPVRVRDVVAAAEKLLSAQEE